MSGYIEYSLIALGHKVTDVAPERESYSGTKDKQDTFMFSTSKFRGYALTSNHTDALAVALHDASKQGMDHRLDALQVIEVEKP